MEDLARQAPGRPSRPDGAPAETQLASILDRVSQALAEATTNYDSTLALIAQTTASVMGGSCVVWITADDGPELSLAAAHDPDEARSAIIARAFHEGRHPFDEGIFAQVLQAAGPITVNPVNWSEITGWATPASPEMLANLGRVALTLVPLRARGTTPGIFRSPPAEHTWKLAAR